MHQNHAGLFARRLLAPLNPGLIGKSLKLPPPKVGPWEFLQKKMFLKTTIKKIELQQRQYISDLYLFH